MQLPDAGHPCTQKNFGGNHVWEARCYRPKSEAEVLEILASHPKGPIRVTGARHSWSDAAVCEEVSIDMSELSSVQVLPGVVRVGGGCPLHHLLDELHSKSDQTLPTIGVITKQTIAGAISTGTHGSGSQGLSHFVVGVRVAAYDPATGMPRIYQHSAGDELRASRCGVGCTGVILSVDVQTVPRYSVEETIRYPVSLAEILARYTAFPLTQFAYVPFEWYFIAFERNRVAGPPISGGSAWFFRLYHALAVDWFSHLLVKVAARFGGPLPKLLFKTVGGLYRVLRDRKRVDLAERVLTMRHDLFQHEEMEIFVPESQLADALDLLRDATEAFAADGRYVHHYPYSMRRVLPEDTLLSMAAGAHEPMYSISIFTYRAARDRASYYGFCAWISEAMTRLYDARLHWGKRFPQTSADVARLCPGLPVFKQVCAGVDPNGVFRNAYTERVLGMSPGPPCAPLTLPTGRRPDGTPITLHN